MDELHQNMLVGVVDADFVLSEIVIVFQEGGLEACRLAAYSWFVTICMPLLVVNIVFNSYACRGTIRLHANAVVVMMVVFPV